MSKQDFRSSAISKILGWPKFSLKEQEIWMSSWVNMACGSWIGDEEKPQIISHLRNSDPNDLPSCCILYEENTWKEEKVGTKQGNQSISLGSCLSLWQTMDGWMQNIILF